MKRVLIITYYWPPSGGGGVQRWLKMSKYLPEFGWQPVIYTPDNPHFELKDQSLLQEVSAEVEVIRQPIWEPFALLKLLPGQSSKHVKQGQVIESGKDSPIKRLIVWLRGNAFIPDPRRFWVRPSVKRIAALHREQPFDAVVTTGPPHSMHLIGLKLKQKLGLYWVADFRDPWSRWDILDKLLVGPGARRRHIKLERRVLQAASKVVTVSHEWRRELEELGSVTGAVAIQNGYDESDFASQQTTPLSAAGPIVMSHIGMINEMRDISHLVAAITRYNPQHERQVELHFTGIISESFRAYVASDPTVAAIVRLQDSLPHREVIPLMQASHLLLLLTNQSKNAAGHIPGKLFEYLAASRPILALGQAGGDVAAILQDTGAGTVSSPFDADQIYAALQAIVAKIDDYQPNANQVAQYSRRNLTARFTKEVLPC